MHSRPTRPRPTIANGLTRRNGSTRSDGMTSLERQMATEGTQRSLQPATAPASSPAPWKPANVRARLQARLTLSEALNLVATMLDSYRGTSTPDPDHYCFALAGALCQHPREIAMACADPVKGVVSECLFRQAMTV